MFHPDGLAIDVAELLSAAVKTLRYTSCSSALAACHKTPTRGIVFIC
jgi:hypothetical protein